MWYGLGAPGISSWVIARFISSAIASRISLVTALDGGPRLGDALGPSFAGVLDTSWSGGRGGVLGACLLAPPGSGAGPAGAPPGAGGATAGDTPRGPGDGRSGGARRVAGRGGVRRR